MSWLGESVLVTGGAGFIGSHLVEELVGAGARVTVLDNSASNLRENLGGNFRLLLGCGYRDIGSCSWSRAKEFDVIFHFAASAYVPPSVKDPFIDFDTNCISTVRLLDALRLWRWPGRLVFASSAAVYGNPATIPVREGDLTVPVSPYGVGKLAAELYATMYAQLHGLRVASLRLFSVYGPRQRKQVVYDLMAKIRDDPDKIEIHGDGTQSRDFTYVSDVVDAAMIVAEKAPMGGEVYNVGAGADISIDGVARYLCALMGVFPEFVYTGINRPGDPEHLAVDIARLRALGYESKVEINDGLMATVDWFKGLQ